MARAFGTRGALTRPDSCLGCPRPCLGRRSLQSAGGWVGIWPRRHCSSASSRCKGESAGCQPCSGPHDRNVAILPSRSNASVGRGSGRVAQLVRAFRLHRRGRGFESLSAHSVVICPGRSLHPGLDAVDQCRGQRSRTASSKVSGWNMHVGRTGRCFSQVAGTGTTIKYCDLPGPSRSRWGDPVTAHRNCLHEIDALGFGMDSRRVARAGWQVGTNDHRVA